ncbi:hypothetical protein OQA88_3253 [Cercophora sp. LCS_1]
MATWRRMTLNDIPGLLRVADAVHPSLPETASVFTERVQLFPSGCLILAAGNKIYGYAISHPIRKDQPPELDSLLVEIPADADQYYIHDVAILPELRGQGHAAKGIRMLFEVSSQFPTTCIVSVYGTGPFWQRFGFEAGLVDGVLSEKLRNYGGDAVYMTRDNAADS